MQDFGHSSRCCIFVNDWFYLVNNTTIDTLGYHHKCASCILLPHTMSNECHAMLKYLQVPMISYI